MAVRSRPAARNRHRDLPGVRPGALSALLEELARAPADETGAAWDRGLHPGAVFGRFELVREVGRGGFGVVYEAKDRSLGRTVAFKAVRAGRDASLREELLLREAEAAARLSHPNIVTLHDVGRSEHGPFLVLELLHGRTLAQRLEEGPLPLAEALSVGLQVARGLAHAHDHGVVHRDLSPGNIHLGDDGQVKVLDLGLAHAFGRPKVRAGTSDYMAPEQAADAPQDERTDVYALGVVLYRAIRGELPSGRERSPDAVAPALDVPALPALGTLVGRMLERDPLKRPRNGGEVAAALAALREELDHPGSPAAASAPGAALGSRRVIALAAALVLVAAALVASFVRREARVRWALQEALPRVAELADRARHAEAFALAKQVEAVLPDDPRLRELWPAMSHGFEVETTPADAEVEVREYGAPDTAWRRLGRTPLRGVRLPLGLYEWRITRPGFVPVDAVEGWVKPGVLREPLTLEFRLDEVGALPPEMVRVPGGEVGLPMAGMDHAPQVHLADFLIDRTEVTNRRFKRFVDSGGYRDPAYWREPFEEGSRPLSFAQAMARFHDRTGRPGPATWESGDYPEGQGDLPVTGVSWYEAAAFAAFEHKALPTVYQWTQAAGLSIPFLSSYVVPRSNFGGKGLAPVTGRRGMGPFGTFDMAGNANEWCRNASGDRRYVLGGAWDETYYYFTDPDAQPPLSRPASRGIRLVRPLGDDDPPSADPLTRRLRDYAHECPVTAEVARAFARHYAYDRAPLDAKVEAVDDASDRWRKEKVSFTAAYGGERIPAFLFTPRDVPPPYQTVVFFPGSSPLVLRSSEALDFMWLLAPVIKSGRALLYPVYRSTYERGDGWTTDVPSPTAAYREHVAMWTKDLRRSLDFVETRPDLDATRVALYGLSWGAQLAPLLVAVEDRIKVGVVVGGGLAHQQCPPEADPFNFAPLVTRPMLMVNGRYDYFFPVETSQVPLFERLGAPERDKRHVILDTRHVPPNDLLTKEVLDWLDRHLGAVR